MRSTKTTAIIAAFLAIQGCAHREPLSNAYAAMAGEVGDRCMVEDTSGGCALFDVSLSELVSVPEKFHKKKVLVIGFVTLAFEGNTLCPSRDTRSGRECVWLDLEGLKDPGFRRGYALLEGHFDGEGRGHLGCCSGAIEKITRLEKWR
jgi:hypothetical protein